MPNRVLEQWEEYAPLIVGIGVFAMMIVWGSDFVEWALSQGWGVENIYSAILSVSAVTSGFLLTFYVVISSRPHPTLERIQKHTKFLDFKRYIKSALKIGIALVVITIPYIVIEPLPQPTGGLVEDYMGVLRNTSVAAWLGLSAVALIAFARVVSNFFLIMDMNIPPRRGAG